jgi:hypothetical protein
MLLTSTALRISFASLLLCGIAFTGIASADDEDVPVAEPVAEETQAPPEASPAPAAARPLSVTVTLLSDTVLAGTLTDTREVVMKTSFGDATIPLSEVAGIRFASSEDAMTTVVMLNGDAITGATDIQKLIVETEWGTATINGTSVGSVLFVPGLSWNSQAGLNGKRWTLVDTKIAAPPAQPVPTVQPGTIQNGVRFQNGVPFGQPVIRSR